MEFAKILVEKHEDRHVLLDLSFTTMSMRRSYVYSKYILFFLTMNPAASLKNFKRRRSSFARMHRTLSNYYVSRSVL